MTSSRYVKEYLYLDLALFPGSIPCFSMLHAEDEANLDPSVTDQNDILGFGV